MEEIISIHSIVHKKKKNVKTKKTLSISQTTSTFLKNFKRHSSNNLIFGEKGINNLKQNTNSSKKRNLSQKNLTKKLSLLKKYDFEDQNKNEPLLCSKNDNLNLHSEKDIKREEEANTPVINLQRNKKPNYLMKSAFIKDKSLTPQEKSFQNSLCPIYDFYRGNSELNSTKNNNLLPNTSFTQYYNNFKIANNPQVNDYYNPSPSPLTNLSDKNNMNYYYNFSFLAKRQNSKEFYEAEKINKISEVSLDEQENNNTIYNIEKEENFGEIKNESKNIEESTPSNIGGTFSPSYDFFDENIFGNDNNYAKSPINYKQMNVNININNNSQNNNIYYQFPNIINSFNNSASNSFYNNNNNSNNNKEMNNNSNNNQSKIDNFNNKIINNIYQNNNQINNNINDNFKNHNIENNNLKKNINNNLNNNKINIANHADFNKGYNNQNNFTNQINYNNQLGTPNFSSVYNNTINQNEINNTKNQLNHLSALNQNISNYLNQYSKLNNNNMNINDILSNNFRSNNINYNINYNNNKNINNQKNINFSSIANAYINQNMAKQNLYNNMNQQLQMPIQNPNKINNNPLNNQAFQYYLNQEKMVYQNNINNQNLNNQLNNFSFVNTLNNLNNANNYNQNNNMRIFNNQMNNNTVQNTNNIIPESFFYQLTPLQLAQNCYLIAKNQNGCRFLQNYISSNPELLKNLFFPKILENIKDISNDQFANYLVKKIFQYLTEEMLLNLIQTLIPLVDQIGTNQYGTRVMQDLIDFLNTEKTFIAFINIIIPHVKLLITDLNGSHIIYKLILTKNKRVKIIEDIICMQVKDIAITRKGCSFLKKYFDFEEENDLIKIKQCILQNLKDIITDQYGNYVIQSILTKEGSPVVKDFINEINKNIVFYSNNKFSSNAVEKCFENENFKNIVLDQFIKKDIFEKIISDKFGNYVVQKAIANADTNRRNYMLQLLLPLIPSLKYQYFGQRLLSKLILQYPNLNISL